MARGKMDVTTRLERQEKKILKMSEELEQAKEEYKKLKTYHAIILAKNYVSNTKYKTLNGDIKPGYKIVSDPDINGFDEFLRVKYPAVLLIELSYMGGNPIGPFGDLDNNYYPTIENNIKALIDNIKLNKKLKPFINRKYDIVDKGFSI